MMRSTEHSQPLVRVLIVEDANFQREGVESVIKPYRDLEIVGVAANAAGALRIAARAAADVVVVNLSADHDLALQVRELLRHLAAVRILVLVNSTDPGIARYLRNAGADELLFGFVRPAVVVQAIRRLGQQAQLLSASAAERG